jgi:hypothetical protein
MDSQSAVSDHLLISGLNQLKRDDCPGERGGIEMEVKRIYLIESQTPEGCRPLEGLAFGQLKRKRIFERVVNRFHCDGRRAILWVDDKSLPTCNSVCRIRHWGVTCPQ